MPTTTGTTTDRAQDSYAFASSVRTQNNVTAPVEMPTGRRVPEIVSSVFVALSMASSVIPTTNFGHPVTAFVRNLDELSSSGSTPVAETTKAKPENTPHLARSVQQIREDSGLTWEQLSRLFGVSRRAVHNWANGGRMTARHVEVLTQLRYRINSLGPSTTAEVRNEILAPREDGHSLFATWRNEFSPDQPSISGSPLTASEALGASPQAD